MSITIPTCNSWVTLFALEAHGLSSCTPQNNFPSRLSGSAIPATKLHRAMLNIEDIATVDCFHCLSHCLHILFSVDAWHYVAIPLQIDVARNVVSYSQI